MSTIKRKKLKNLLYSKQVWQSLEKLSSMIKRKTFAEKHHRVFPMEYARTRMTMMWDKIKSAIMKSIQLLTGLSREALAKFLIKSSMKKTKKPRGNTLSKDGKSSSCQQDERQNLLNPTKFLKNLREKLEDHLNKRQRKNLMNPNF